MIGTNTNSGYRKPSSQFMRWLCTLACAYLMTISIYWIIDGCVGLLDKLVLFATVIFAVCYTRFESIIKSLISGSLHVIKIYCWSYLDSLRRQMFAALCERIYSLKTRFFEWCAPMAITMTIRRVFFWLLPPDVASEWADIVEKYASNLSFAQILDIGSLFVHATQVFRSKKNRLSMVVHIMCRLAPFLHGYSKDAIERVQKFFTAKAAEVEEQAGEEEDDTTTILEFLAEVFTGTKRYVPTMRTFVERGRAALTLTAVIRLAIDLYRYFRPSEEVKRCDKWIRRVTEILEDPPSTFDPPFKAEMNELWKEGNLILEVYYRGPPDMKKRFSTAFFRVWSNYKDFYSKNKFRFKDMADRMEPVTIVFGHESGTGKSTMMEKVERHFAEKISGVKWQDGAKDLLYVFSRNANMRTDGMTSHHKLMRFDDIFQYRDKATTANEATLFCRVASKEAFCGDQAALESKQTPLAPVVVTATTNTNLHAGVELGIQSSFAVLRRIDAYVSLPKFEGEAKTNPKLKDFTTVTVKMEKGVACDKTMSIKEFFQYLDNIYDTKKKAFANAVDDWDEDRDFLEGKEKTESLSDAEYRDLVIHEHFGTTLDAVETQSYGDSVSELLVGYTVMLCFYLIFAYVYNKLWPPTPVEIRVYKRRGKHGSQRNFGHDDSDDELSSAEKELRELQEQNYLKENRSAQRERQRLDVNPIQVSGQNYLKENRSMQRQRQRLDVNPTVVSQSIDETAEDIMFSIRSNLCWIGVKTDSSSRIQCATGIAGHVVLANEHLLLGALDDPDAVLVLWRPNVKIPVFLRDCTIVSLQNDKVLIANKKFGNQFPSIVRHFIRAEDIPVHNDIIHSHTIRYGRWAKGRTDETGYDIVRAISESYRYRGATVTLDTSRRTVRGYFQFFLSTDHGDCGSLYVSQNVHDQRKIMAMHFAQETPGVAAAVPITQEELNTALFSFYPSGYDIKDEYAQVMQTEADIQLLRGDEAEKMREECPPGFLFIGQNARKCHIHPETSIHPSDLQKFIPAKTFVAKRKPWVNSKGEKVIPKDYFFGKGEQPALVDKKLVSSVVKEVLANYPGPNPKFKSVLTLDEALNGIEGTMFHALNHATSGGYRLRFHCKKGKKPYIRIDEDDGFKLKPSNLAIRDLAKRLKIARDHPPFSVAKDTQKDERYSYPEWDTDLTAEENFNMRLKREAKYRVVSSDDAADLILLRQFFGAILDAMRRTMPYGRSQVGINAWSHHFDMLFNYLNEYGDNILSLDGKAWDFILAYEVVYGFIEFCEEWYDRHFDVSEVERTIRRHLLEKYLCHGHIFLDLVYARIGGMLSGFFATAETNGVCNEIINRILFRLLCPGKHYDTHVRAAFYGDDMIASVRGAPEFNQVSFAEAAKKHLGMTWTTDDKKAPTEMYTSIFKTSFISRYFRRIDRRFSTVVGALDKSVIRDIPLWVSSRDPKERVALLRQNIDASLREMFLHGRKAYDDWKAELDSCLARMGMPATELTWEYLYGEWKKSR